MRQSRHITALIIALAAVLGFQFIAPATASPKGARWNETYFPHYTVTDQHGNKHSFFNDLLLNKIVIIDFIYTTCADICPLNTARMAEVQDLLGDRLGKEIFIYSITLEPEVDTPELLNLYAGSYGAKPGWLFLTGEPAEIKEIRYKLGERSRDKTEHRARIVLGNDRTGEWRPASIMSDLKILVDDILRLDPDYKPAPSGGLRVSKKVEPINLSDDKRRGEAFFQRACSYCHSIGKGDGIGPDLAGVTERRSGAWLNEYLRDPNGMLARKDPQAVALAQAYPARMPDFGLSDGDIADLMTYLRRHASRPAMPERDAATSADAPADHQHGPVDHKQGG